MVQVFRADDLGPGEGRRVVVANHPVAVFHAEGRLFAIDDTCTHQDASLSEGWLEGCLIECPLHASFFDLRTGEVTSPPAKKPVRTYHVEVRDGMIEIDLDRRGGDGMTVRETAVVVGASLAGLSAVRALRQQGFDGRVVLLGDEPHLPYDRPPLSKGFLLGTVSREKIELADETELDALDVERRFGTPATGLRPADRVVLVGEDELVADHVVLATGSRPRLLRGTQALPGVHLLRTLDDAVALREALVPGVRLAVVGAGFIGSEVASAARTLGADVTVIELLDVPLSLPLGEQMGSVCAALHAANGVDLRTGVGVAGLRGQDRVTGVELSDGSVVDADLVLVGVGAAAVTGWLDGSGLAIDNGVLTDPSGLTSVPHVAAVGDVARPAGPWTAAPTRVEHWTNALENPARTITALLGGDVAAMAAPRAPYFWSDQYGVMIQFAGHREPGDEVRVVEGDPADGSFVAVYDHGETMSAVMAMNAGRSFNRLRRQLVPRHSEVPA